VSLLSLPVRRPVATAMFYLALVMLGLIAWQRIPVELFPELSGDRLTVFFSRPGSEPEVIEREILLPLEGRVRELAGISETWGRVSGSSGTYGVRFEPGVDLKVAELELRRIATEIERAQPRGSVVEAGGSEQFSAISKFVMVVQVSGAAGRGPLRDIVADRVEPRLESVPGVRDVLVFGGGDEGVEVRLDPRRLAAAGALPDEVAAALQRIVVRRTSVGAVEEPSGRRLVLVDAEPEGPFSIGAARLHPERPLRLRHVAQIDRTHADEREVFRVNGEPAIGAVIFKHADANLVRLGNGLRARVAELDGELAPLGVQVSIVSDAAELVSDQIERLERLAGSGYLIALAVLFLFLRRLRGVLVVAVTAPVSLLTALAFLYVSGTTFNLLSLFGLAVGLGMLVDNGIVVFEAVQRQLEHGRNADDAAREGARRTARAIVAATATNAVVFFPLLLIEIEGVMLRAVLAELAVAYLLPLAASLLVALGLVPLLARRLAAPAAMARLAEERARRREQAGLAPPDRGRELFAGLVRTALVSPGLWLTGVGVAVGITVVVTSTWFAVSGGADQPPEAEEVQVAVRLDRESTLEQTTAVVERLEREVLDIPGVDRVSTMVQESSASLTVTLADRDERPPDTDAALVRGRLDTVVQQQLDGVTLLRPGEEDPGGGSGGHGGAEEVFGQAPREIRVSHPDRDTLWRLAHEIRRRLGEIEEIGPNATIGQRAGMDEIIVDPRERMLEGLGMTSDQVLPALSVVRREGVVMQTTLGLADGRELPVTVLRETEPRSRAELARTQLATPGGSFTLGSLATLREVPASPPIVHRDGRRELSVRYQFTAQAPDSGPRRVALEQRVEEAVRGVHRPSGATIDLPQRDEQTSWFRKVLIPVVLSLLAVLALTFESLVLPLLVLVALPLTLIGATWALVLAGMPAGAMALVGATALIGLTVNPAILLVDRMQQLARAGWPAGGAALGAVRERARPVLMTTATTLAALWPLALATGQENEIWPPFATVVMGGLAVSTLLTLLVLPVGYVLLRRLDDLFGRIGPWVVLGWLTLTTACVTPLFVTETITSLTWQIVVTVLIGAGWLGAIVLGWQRPPVPEPEAAPGRPPRLEIRSLHKTYGQPGPIRSALRAPDVFARRVLARGGRTFLPARARDRIAPLLLLSAGATYLAWFVEATFWNAVWVMAASALAAWAVIEVRRARGRVDELGRVLPGGVEGVIAVAAPWIGWVVLALWGSVIPRLEEQLTRGWSAPAIGLGLLAVLTALVQAGRRTALAVGRGEISTEATGRARRLRSLWRSAAHRVFGLDVPVSPVRALSNVELRVEGGLVGVLGPNGAGKTTLLRVLAGILDPSVGRVTLGGVPLPTIRSRLARWVGYLPQDFGLPGAVTVRRYLDYYALLYELTPASERRRRVGELIEEVGLTSRADHRIDQLSGGMRQRVAIARTLLRLPAVVIVDEPTVGLDPRERIRLRNLLGKLAAGRIVLFSTHVVEDVAVACRRVVVLADGKVVFDGEPERLAERAEGRVWELRLTGAESWDPPAACTVVDQSPEPDGGQRFRLVADAAPDERARPVEPSLEDGYLVLTGLRRGTS
jgi:multidrug efflux pump subunit AcrB/ABC-type multidrug transport system ATPase subunit